eukprot:TRINITY_DN3365_c1_g2_i1.p1 TRINITY_DN3365_c1_g2~~TRINITY_DN3365_c1_g2_i1.p1  ORF type:complete len:347 (+),score=88.65 TRINITY_DN3365_c1_g2_i1:89-1129(+)
MTVDYGTLPTDTQASPSAGVSSIPSGSPARESVSLEVRSEHDAESFAEPDGYDSDPKEDDHAEGRKNGRALVVYATIGVVFVFLTVVHSFHDFGQLAQRVQSAESALRTTNNAIAVAQEQQGSALSGFHTRLDELGDAQGKHDKVLNGIATRLTSISATQEKDGSVISGVRTRLDGVTDSLQSTSKALAAAQGAHQQLATEVQQDREKMTGFIRTEELLRQWSTRNNEPQSAASQRAPNLPQAFVVNSPPRPDINGKYYLLPPRPDAKAAVWGGGPSGRGWIYMDTNNCWVVSAGSKSTNKAIGQYWTSDSPCSADSTSPDGLWWWYYDSVSQKWVFSDSISVTAA